VQLTFALLLELTHHVGEHNDSVHRGEWVACQDFSYSLTPLIELEGLTMGIVGLGNIGRGVAAVARAFGMEIATLDRPSAQGLSGVRRMSLEELFAVSDVVSLHSPQTPETTGMVNRDLLSRMKPSAFLLNTSRGGLIVEQDLADALNEGKIAGAGLDVLSVEPPKPDNPLLTAKNCVITPHIAWASLSARRRLLDVTFKNVEAFLTGNPQNVVNA
jgi:glycerate dehydrogenase